MAEPELSDNEFGKYFELGMKARALGKPKSKSYKHPIRTMAWHDGYNAADAAINNPTIPDSPETILADLQQPTQEQGE